jgi:hypothetical protein
MPKYQLSLLTPDKPDRETLENSLKKSLPLTFSCHILF